MDKTLVSLHRHLSDWPVISSGTTARHAKNRWAETHPGVLGGYCPGTLVDAYASLSTPLQVVVLQALLSMAPDDEVAARTVLQLVVPVIRFRANRYGARVGSVWATLDELVCDAVTETWRIVQHHPGLRDVQYPAPRIGELLGGRLRTKAVSWDRAQRRHDTVRHATQLVISRSSDAEELTLIEEVREILVNAHQARMITSVDASMIWDGVVLDRSDQQIALTVTAPGRALSDDARRQRVQHRRHRIIDQLSVYAAAEAAAA